MGNKKNIDADYDYNRFNKFKILAHAENIQRLLNSKTTKPIVVDIELSNFCNQNCIWCEPYSYRKENEVMLSSQTIKRAIEDAVSLGAKLVRFCGGGEPMTNPFWGQSLKIAKKKGLRVVSNTNGTLIHQYTDTIVDYCDFFRVSLDAATSETYNELHKPNNKEDFKNILRGLEELTKKREKKSSSVEIGVAFLIHYKNYTEIPLITKLMREIGIDFVHFRPVYLPYKKENQNLINIIDRALEKVVESKQKFVDDKFKVFGITRKMSGVWFKRNWKTCHSPFFLPVLGATGNIYACCDRRDLCLGNFAKEGFAKIYRKKNFKEKTNAIDVEKCMRCTNSDLNEVIYYCFEQDCLKTDLL